MMIAASLAVAIGLAAPQKPADMPLPLRTMEVGAGAGIFPFACLWDLDKVELASDFSSQIAEWSATLEENSREFSDRLAIDGMSGSGCRIRYMGKNVDLTWKAYTQWFPSWIGTQPCKLVERTDNRVLASCLGAHHHGDEVVPRHFDYVIERRRDAEDASADIALTNLRP